MIWDFDPEGVGLLEVDYKTEDLAGMPDGKFFNCKCLPLQA